MIHVRTWAALTFHVFLPCVRTTSEAIRVARSRARRASASLIRGATPTTAASTSMSPAVIGSRSAASIAGAIGTRSSRTPSTDCQSESPARPLVTAASRGSIRTRAANAGQFIVEACLVEADDRAERHRPDELAKARDRLGERRTAPAGRHGAGDHRVEVERPADRGRTG